MQMKIWSPWKIVAAFALVGLLAAIAFSLLTPDRYVSHAVLKIDHGGSDEVNIGAAKILSRSSLTQLINKEDLYKGERAREPIEDVIQQMKNHDIIIRPGDPGEFVVSFAAPDAATAQRTTQYLATAFVDANVGSLVAPASLPVSPNGPRRSRIIILGLVTGVLAGMLFALFSGLKMWKVAAGLGIAGAIVGAAIAFVLPERFASSAFVHYQARPGGSRIVRQLVAAITNNDAGLRAIVQRYKLYPNESEPERRLREHLHIEPLGNLPAIMIRFDDRDRYIAQKVVADVVALLMEEAIRDRAGSGPNANMTLELLDPPSLPLNAFSPKRGIVVGTGLFVGLACAVLVGVRRHYKTPLPVVAAQ